MPTPLTVSVTKVQVLHFGGTDHICIQFEGNSPFPTWIPEDTPTFRLDVARGHALSWLWHSNLLPVGFEIELITKTGSSMVVLTEDLLSLESKYGH